MQGVYTQSERRKLVQTMTQVLNAGNYEKFLEAIDPTETHAMGEKIKDIAFIGRDV